MADEHSDNPSGGDNEATDAAPDGLEPTGGPRRVVSDQSVDDILASLEETTASTDPTPQSTTVRSRATERPDSEPPSTSGSSGDGGHQPRDGTAPAEDADSDDTSHEHDVGDGASDDAGHDIDASDGDTTNTASDGGNADTADVGDHTGGSPASDADGRPSIDELRLNRAHNEITGADVRAAESGVGRESTPDVGDLDISLDDLERTAAELDGESASGDPSGASPDDPAGPDDAGPLAGTIDTDGPAPADSADSDDSVGVLGRLKLLFSR